MGKPHLCHHRWNVSSGPARGPWLRTGGRAGSMTSPAGRGEGTAWPEPGDCLCGPWSHSPGREGWEDMPLLSSPWPSLPGPKKALSRRAWAQPLGQSRGEMVVRCGIEEERASFPPKILQLFSQDRAGRACSPSPGSPQACCTGRGGPRGHRALQGVGRWPGCTLAEEAPSFPPRGHWGQQPPGGGFSCRISGRASSLSPQETMTNLL